MRRQPTDDTVCYARAGHPGQMAVRETPDSWVGPGLPEVFDRLRRGDLIVHSFDQQEIFFGDDRLRCEQAERSFVECLVS